MICPKCNQPTERHIEARLFDCPLTEAQALLAAQRHSAAKLFVEIYHREKTNTERCVRIVEIVEDALKKTGIIQPGEKYENLLDELTKEEAS